MSLRSPVLQWLAGRGRLGFVPQPSRWPLRSSPPVASHDPRTHRSAQALSPSTVVAAHGWSPSWVRSARSFPVTTGHQFRPSVPRRHACGWLGWHPGCTAPTPQGGPSRVTRRASLSTTPCTGLASPAAQSRAPPMTACCSSTAASQTRSSACRRKMNPARARSRPATPNE